MRTSIILGCLLLTLSQLFSQNSTQQEIYLMGTMHEVPTIVKNSYKPMLKKAITYGPDAIYVESPMANDSISWDYLRNGWSKNYIKFYKLSDSMQRTFKYDSSKLDAILKKEFDQMSRVEINYAINSFAFLRDHANYEFYKYISKYGITGSNRPTRHEDGDLSFKLALELNKKRLISMDDQQTNDKYHDAWQRCAKEGRTNGNNRINSKLNKKNYNSSIVPAIFRNLGNHTNKRKQLELLHELSSFRYVKTQTPGCSEGTKFWDQRNMRMAKNIATQVMDSKLKKNIVIVGASHIIGLEKELKDNYPNLKVTLMND